VPGDNEQVIYVWFDALINYISTLSWPDGKEFKEFWPCVQVAGKDNLRQQSAMFQAMLMSAGVENSKKVLIFGFLTNEGQKISKSLGNAVDLNKVVAEFGSEAIRYFLLSAIPTYSDGDFSRYKLAETYNADLANGLGNLVARLANLIERDNLSFELSLDKESEIYKEFCRSMDNYELQEAINLIWKKIKKINEYLSAKAPWKEDDIKKREKVLKKSAEELFNIACLLKIFLPESGEKLVKQFSAKQIKKSESLFPRLNIEKIRKEEEIKKEKEIKK
jgi:methionyl-tRNA synthetase